MSDNKIEFYNIEAEHLADLRAVAIRLRDTGRLRMNAYEMDTASDTIMKIVRFAEALHVIRQPGEPFIHVTEHVFPELFQTKKP